MLNSPRSTAAVFTSLSSSLRSQGTVFALHTREHTHAGRRASAAAPSLGLPRELRRASPTRARRVARPAHWLRQRSACQVGSVLRGELLFPRSFRLRSRSWSRLRSGQFTGRSFTVSCWRTASTDHARMTARETVVVETRAFRCSRRAVKRHAACFGVVIS